MAKELAKYSWKKYKKHYPVTSEEKDLRDELKRKKWKRRVIPGFIFIISSLIVCSYWSELSQISFSLKSVKNIITDFGSNKILYLTALSTLAQIISLYFTINPPKSTQAHQLRKKIKDFTHRLPRYFPKHYVDIDCQDINPADDSEKHPARQSLRKNVWEWMFDPNEEKWKYLQLLGDFGTGKTTFCFYLGQEIIATMLSLDVEIIELGTENLDLNDRLSKIADREHTILMLDAYDEYRGRGGAENEFLIMQDLTRNFFKVIITSRTNYFSCTESEPCLNTKYVSYFNEEQIKYFFKMKYGFRWQKYWYMLARYQQLTDLSRRVIVLNYLNQDILTAIQKAEEMGIEINNYHIYEKIIDNILNRVKERNADKMLPPRHAKEIMSLLGFYIICCDGETQIYYELLGEKLLQLFDQFQLSYSNLATYFKKEELLNSCSHLITEIRTRTFLVRDNAGYYRFAHRSFAEYFAARFILEVMAKTSVSSNRIKIKFKLPLMVNKFLNEANRPEAIKKLLDLIEPLFVFRKSEESISPDDASNIIKKYDFYEKHKNRNGKGIIHRYLPMSIDADEVVFDFETGLMWQQGGSSEYMDYEKAKEHIAELKKKQYAGYHDWRLPTLEEAMSLMEPERKENDLYIDPVFDSKQRWIWTSDLVKGESEAAWVVYFYYGSCAYDSFGFNDYVRAVRSGQSSTE